MNYSHLKNSENNTFLLILTKKNILSSLVKITQQNRLRMCSGVFHVYFFVHCSFFFFIPLFYCLRSADDERVSRTVEVETLIPKLADKKNEKEQDYKKASKQLHHIQ